MRMTVKLSEITHKKAIFAQKSKDGLRRKEASW